MGKIECPKCKRKSLKERKMYGDYICDHRDCEAIFDKDLNEIHVKGKEMHRDDNGNYYTIDFEKNEKIIKQTKIYYLEPNKTTLRGEYRKFRTDINCKYPERLSCNYGMGCERCEYMKYGGSLGNWNCTYDKKEEEKRVQAKKEFLEKKKALKEN